PGPGPRWALFVAAISSPLLPLVLTRWRRESGSDDGPSQPGGLPGREQGQRLFLTMFALLLLLTIVLRYPNLSYKEFQGDEGVIMERAAAALLGDDAQLFLHQKGPVEILIPLFTWGLGGSINEFWTRLPFTAAGVLTVLAVYLLARAWIGKAPALLAAFLFTINGFAVAFSRIVQYQSFVMLWTVLAVLYAVRFRRSGRGLDLSLSAAFMAAGLLAHYDALMVAPLLAWLVAARIRVSERVPWSKLATATAIGAVLLATFYVPFAVSPTLADTGRYLLGDRLGGSLFSWSGLDAWRMATYYNSTYYVAALLLLALVAGWRLRNHPSYPVLLGLPLVPLLFYTVAVADPRTHIYTIFPGAAILAAGGAYMLWNTLPSPVIRRIASLLLLLYLAVSTVYVYLLFVDVAVERQRNWETAQIPMYPTTWEEPPLYGLFGFPHQSGWRVAATLSYDWPYASNEEQEVSGWYMAQAPRTHCADFETFFLADNVQDPAIYDAEALADLHLRHQIAVNGRQTLQIYHRQPGPVEQWQAEGSTLWRTPQQVVPPQPKGDHPVDVVLGARARLLGYDLQEDMAYPGGALTVVLYWEPLVPFERNFQTFVHLYDGVLHAQHDSAPDCAMYPTTHWEPGRVVRDAHIVELPEDIPTDRPIPVLVGMYDLLSEERLAVDGSDADTVEIDQVIPGHQP
ncbi:MAG TPA: glycosyltransferase family 39 protein, partial [Candidatus Sulfomarinibacteraceae bacterium]|nr:glycosyltransferase family 39 protein [Candidatus Sulfomarinibacteraceae bacterium]